MIAIGWTLVMFAACFGYGVAIERAFRFRQGLGVTIATGIVALCAFSLLVAYLGCLVPPVQYALVAGGLGLCWIDRVRQRRAPTSWRSIVVAALAGMILIAIAALLRDVPIADDANRGFLVKQLADTGRISGIHQGLGLAIIADSYWCLARGAADAAVFEQGAAAALALLVLAELCRDRREVFALAVVATIGASTWLDDWSAVPLLLAAHVALTRTQEVRRRGGHAIILALGLGLLRYEYLFAAFPFVAAAIALPRRPLPSPRALQWIAGAWLVFTVVVQLGLVVPVSRGAVHAIALAPCFLIFLVRRPVAALACAALLLALGAGLDAFRSAHAAAALSATWISLGLALVAEQPAPIALVSAAALIWSVVWPACWSWDARRHIAWRFERAIDAARFATPDDAALAALQAKAPAHARLGFWGRDAAQLDFRRNPIRDASWPRQSRRYREYLMMLSPATLAGLDYVLVERLPPSALLDPHVADPWGANASAVEPVASLLTLVEANGYGALYRIAKR